MLRAMSLLIKRTSRLFSLSFATGLLVLLVVIGGASANARPVSVQQSGAQLTPRQREIANQSERLKSDDIEVRRDALMRLGSLRRPEASRAAVAGLTDIAAIVRATATHAILSLPPEDAATLLIPLVQDKLEFVRRETVFALGKTRNRSAVAPLLSVLTNDKDTGVQSAAAVALGEIGDESAVELLSQVLAGTTGKKKSKSNDNPFTRRAAARSLGQIKSRASVGVLISVLTNDANDNDVRREAATALGLIGDTSAAPALQATVASTDPYLSEAARTALGRLKNMKN
jgi:HEAT repeat protein